MAMFVLVVDTSLMNVSISAVVGISARSAASSRRSLRGAGVCRLHPDREQGRGSLRAQAGIHLGLLAYAVGALAMTLAQDLTTIIIFWAIIGGLGASLLLPSMQSSSTATSRAPLRRGSTPWWGRRLRSPLPWDR